MQLGKPVSMYTCKHVNCRNTVVSKQIKAYKRANMYADACKRVYMYGCKHVSMNHANVQTYNYVSI